MEMAENHSLEFFALLVNDEYCSELKQVHETILIRNVLLLNAAMLMSKLSNRIDVLKRL